MFSSSVQKFAGSYGKLHLFYQVFAHADIHEDSDAQHHAEDGGTAVTDKRQRNTNHRHQSHYHSNVNENLPADQCRDSNGQKRAKRIPAPMSDVQAPDNQQLKKETIRPQTR